MTALDAPALEIDRLERALRDRVEGEIRFDAGTRAAYSTDSSNFRQVPIAVVVPRSVEAVPRRSPSAASSAPPSSPAAAAPAWPASAPTRP